MSRPCRISFLATLAVLAFLAVSANAGAAGSGTYPAQLTVAGELTVTTKHDYTGPCERGQAWTITSKATVNISGKTDLGWIRQGGVVNSTGTRDPGGAVNRNTLSGYAESNLCEDPIPFEESEKPQCSTNSGVGTASVGGSRGKIFVGIGRQGGREQESSCQGGFVTRPKPTGTQIATLQSDVDEMSLPLGVGVGAFAKLRVGQKLTRKIRVNGPCELGTVAKTSLFRPDVCTVSGSLTVTVKRLAGKGRGGFTTARAR